MYLHVMTQPARPLLQLPCACANLRRATRVVTQIYDRELRKVGMRAPQFTVLQVLARKERVSQRELADVLAMDSTTLTRTLGLLRVKGWIESSAARDRRRLQLSLTRQGLHELRRAVPRWEAAQRKLRALLGEAAFARIMRMSLAISAIKH